MDRDVDMEMEMYGDRWRQSKHTCYPGLVLSRNRVYRNQVHKH